MERFSAEQFYMIGRVIEQLGNDLNPNPFFANKIVDSACQESFFESVGGIKIHCAKIGLRQSVKCCDQLLTDAKDPLIATHSLTHAQLGNFIEQLGDLVRWEMQDHLFMHIPASRSERYGKEELFGKGVSTAFPSASFDIREAGNCYAAGLCTASVFHLMRVLEIGLGVFGGVFNLELGQTNWHPFIEQIESKIAELGKAPGKSVAQKKKHEEYSQAASSFMIFKDAWRNYTAHARGRYTEKEADSILRNVEAFMRQLTKIGLKEAIE